MKIYLREREWENGRWMELAQTRAQWEFGINNVETLGSATSVRTSVLRIRTLPQMDKVEYLTIMWLLRQNLGLYLFTCLHINAGCARYRIWLRNCATSRKVAGSSPGCSGIFNLPNTFSRTMALGLTQPLKKMSTRNLPGVKSGRRVGLTTLLPSVSRMSENVGASTSRKPKGLHGLYRDNFTLPYKCLTSSIWMRSCDSEICGSGQICETLSIASI
jgi:hypothetical protein